MPRGKWGTPKIATGKVNSQNSKIGDAATTYTGQGSCPESCPFYAKACYALQGPIGNTFRNLTIFGMGKTPLEIAQAEANLIDSFDTTKPLRLHSSGDCKTNEAAQTVGGASERFIERGGGAVWTYSHAWQDVDRESWTDSVSVLASCETMEEVELAYERGYAAAMVVEKHPEDGKAYKKRRVQPDTMS